MTSDVAGARWWRFDFHTHTPASKDYAKGSDQGALQRRSPREWLLDFMRAEIDCVAVTDHNTGAWIDRLKQAYRELERSPPDDFRPLVLFPGVEITVHGGVHVLAILDPAATGSQVEALLGAAGLPNDAAGSLEAMADKTVREVARAILDSGALVIPAHVDADRGIFNTFTGTTLKQVLENKDIIAVEALDAGVVEHRQPAWSAVVGSDSHHPSGTIGQQYPGSRYTWVKMGRPSIQGLRLALIDGAPLSLLRSDSHAEDPNRHSHLVVESIAVHEAQYAGRGAGPLEARFSPWMSALIGGRGTGKSTIIEMLRLALGRAMELPDEMREEFESFSRIPASRTDRGALTERTKLTVAVRKDRRRLRLIWESGTGKIEEQTREGRWERSTGEVQDRFPVRIYSQKQLFALARDQSALLRVVDSAPELRLVEWNARWRRLETRFLSYHTKIRELDAQLQERPRVEGQLADVKQKLTIFEQGSHRQRLLDYQKYSRQRRALDERLTELQQAVERSRSFAEEIGPADVRDDGFDRQDGASVEALGLLHEAANRQHALTTSIITAANELSDFEALWRDRIVRSEWTKREKKVRQEYQGLVALLEQAGVDDPSEYGALVQHRHSLESRLSEMGTVADRIRQLHEQAASTLKEMETLRAELTRRRIAFLDSVLQGSEFVSISVVPFGENAVSAEPTFRRHLSRDDERMQSDILAVDKRHGILAELYRELPDDGEERIRRSCERVARIKQRMARIYQGASEARLTKWFHNHVRGMRPEQIDRFMLWWPEDGLRVSYRRGNAGRLLVPIEQGSPGQKSAAMLAFLLSHGDEPIVLDQPEDDLDNHLIYDLMVRQLRASKRSRQVIVATHNPNVVVNGDAELVISMDHRNGQCVMVDKGTGSLQDQGVRDEVCRVMEGGRQAFERRYRRLLQERGDA